MKWTLPKRKEKTTRKLSKKIQKRSDIFKNWKKITIFPFQTTTVEKCISNNNFEIKILDHAKEHRKQYLSAKKNNSMST